MSKTKQNMRSKAGPEPDPIDENEDSPKGSINIASLTHIISAILKTLDTIDAKVSKIRGEDRIRSSGVLTAKEAAAELRCSVDHLRRYYVRKKLLIPLPRRSPGDGKGKRGGRLKFRAEDVARLNGRSW